MYSMILAIDNNKLIGKTGTKNGLPWHYAEDLQFYKEVCQHKVNIMGRKTFEQIGHPLPNRTTYVLTRNPDFAYPGVIATNTIEQFDEIAQEQEVMVIGGVDIFELFWEKITRIYLTKIAASYEGDVYYENFSLAEFELVSQKKGQHADLTFEVWERK